MKNWEGLNCPAMKRRTFFFWFPISNILYKTAFPASVRASVRLPFHQRTWKDRKRQGKAGKGKSVQESNGKRKEGKEFKILQVCPNWSPCLDELFFFK